MKGYKKYYTQKIVWYLITLIFAVALNFVLPRLMPGDPVSAIAGQAAEGMTDAQAIKKVYDEYIEKFGVNQPIPVQFAKWLKGAVHGDFGVSFSQYPRTVADIIKSSVGWTLALQLPAILLGWLLGNVLGAVAAYIKGVFDKVILPAFLFISNVPAFGMAVVLLTIFGVTLGWAPTSGAYGYDLIPNMSWTFVKSVFAHYQLPFWAIVLTTIGGQAIGIKDRKIVGYVFRNAMLPQITGLAMSLGTMMGGALVSEIIFSYPGIGTTMMSAIKGNDYPLLSACTLIITVMVLVANLLVEIIYGVIDPRIKAAQQD